MNVSGVNVIPYARRYRRDLMNLLQTDEYLHIHLDWNSVDEWLSDSDTPIFLAFREQTLLGAMAGSPPLDGSAWLRLIAVSHRADLDSVLGSLWSVLKVELVTKGIHEAAVLALRPWIVPHIERLGFTFRDSIVTLRREGIEVPPPIRSDVKVRTADWREGSNVALVDHAAFSSIWQLSSSSLQQAARSSSSFTVAELENRVVGYQISTLYRDGAHLARLATLPAIQGTGVGGVLLTELIQYFNRRGVHSVSVNTQQSNAQSLRLYQRFGFEFTGLNMDVWSIRL